METMFLLKGLSHSMDQSNKMYTQTLCLGYENGNELEKVFNRRLSDLTKFIVDISDILHLLGIYMGCMTSLVRNV